MQRSPRRVSNPDAIFDTDGVTKDLSRLTVRGTAATVVAQAVRFLIGIAGTVILARLLTPRDYGLIGMVAAVLGFIAIFRDLGLDSALIQRADVTGDQISALFWINTATGAALAVATAAIAPIAAWFYGEPSLTYITIVSALGFVLSGSIVQHEALLRRQMRFARLATVDIGSVLIGSAAGILLAWRGAEYWALVLSQLATAFVRVCGLWACLDWRPRLAPQFAGIRPMLAFGAGLTGFTFLNYFARNLDNVLLGRYWGASQLGLYSRGYQLMTLPIDQINGPITTVAVPALSRLADSPERYRHAYLRIIEKIAMVTMPLMAFLIMTSDWVVEVVLGPRWQGVSPIFALLGFVGILQPIASTTGWLFVTQGRTFDMFRWGLIGCTLTVASIIVGLPWGAVGVAASYSLTSLVVVIPLLFWFVGRSGPVRARDIYRTIGLSLAMVPIVMVTLFLVRRSLGDVDSLLGLAVALGATGCVAVIVLYISASGRAAVRDIVSSVATLGTARSTPR
ncbi:MAG: lipopolysaccharide biosynthesis protein [Candidatus Rokuibacteriota bacterium]|nr:MAG: lipopolysaccharide biosynthesis protein [Candidatus Rokubacteria bacterium]